MTTDNRTNEQAIETAARVIYDHSAVNDEGNVCQCGHETGYDLAFHQAERLHAAGRLAKPSMSESNVSETVIGLHFTEAQIEAADRASIRVLNETGNEKFFVTPWRLRHQMIRAALVAAASVAPMQRVSESDLAGRLERATFEVESVHQIHGIECLCGFSSARSRSRTEHITRAVLAALGGESR